MTKSFDIDQIVQDLLTEMPLKEKAAIANLDEDKVPLLQYAFDVYLKHGLGMDDETSKDVMHRIWEVLGDASGSVCEVEQICRNVIVLFREQYPFAGYCEGYPSTGPCYNRQ
jgi:hypothetical protein